MKYPPAVCLKSWAVKWALSLSLLLHNSWNVGRARVKLLFVPEMREHVFVVFNNTESITGRYYYTASKGYSYAVAFTTRLYTDAFSGSSDGLRAR